MLLKGEFFIASVSMQEVDYMLSHTMSESYDFHMHTLLCWYNLMQLPWLLYFLLHVVHLLVILLCTYCRLLCAHL